MSQAGSCSSRPAQAADQGRIEEGHVALQVDHHVVAPVRVEHGQGRQDAVGARGQGGVGQHRAAARRLDRLDDLRIAGRHRDRTDAGGLARRSTRTIIGRPPMSARGLPGSRVAAMRAGMSTIGFMRSSARSARRRRCPRRPHLAGCAAAGSVSETRAQGQARGRAAPLPSGARVRGLTSGMSDITLQQDRSARCWRPVWRSWAWATSCQRHLRVPSAGQAGLRHRDRRRGRRRRPRPRRGCRPTGARTCPRRRRQRRQGQVGDQVPVLPQPRPGRPEHDIGPNLYGVRRPPARHHPGFAYSAAHEGLRARNSRSGTTSTSTTSSPGRRTISTAPR